MTGNTVGITDLWTEVISNSYPQYRLAPRMERVDFGKAPSHEGAFLIHQIQPGIRWG